MLEVGHYAAEVGIMLQVVDANAGGGASCCRGGHYASSGGGIMLPVVDANALGGALCFRGGALCFRGGALCFKWWMRIEA